MTTTQKKRVAQAKRNLAEIRRLLSNFDKKTKQHDLLPTYGQWVNSFDNTVGAGVEPAPGSVPDER